MNAVDYKAKAEHNIEGLHDWQGEQGQTDATLLTLAIEAQVNATLHLANQQHIANLLAYQALHPNSHTTLDNSVADQITEAMGA